MKTLLLTASGSRLAGGLYTTITSYSKAMLSLGIKPVVMSYTDDFWEEDKLTYGNVSTTNYRRMNIMVIKNLGFSTDIHHIVNKEHADIIHQQGIWMYYSYASLLYKKRNPRTVLIIEPHGMLDPWAVKNSAWKKKIVGWLYEYRNLRSADCIHALCQSEYESIRKFGLKNPVAIIPNGINLPQVTSFDRNGNRKTLLFIGRIHPKKGLKELLFGLSILKRNNSKFFDVWNVKIAGWSQIGHIDELKRIVQENHLEGYVEFVGELHGNEKEKLLCEANAFILPSFSEGLPMSILEAWAYQLPVLMTDYCNIPEGFSSNSAIRIEPSAENIASSLETLSSLSNDMLVNMGLNGYSLAKQKFCWEEIAKQTIQLYEYLLNGGEKPSFVYE